MKGCSIVAIKGVDLKKQEEEGEDAFSVIKSYKKMTNKLNNGIEQC